MKTITMTLSLLTCLAGTVYAAVPRVTLEVLDKDPKPVWLAIKNGNLYFTKAGWKEYAPELDKDIIIKYEGASDPKGYPYGYQVNTADTTTMALWLNDPKSVHVVKQEGKSDTLLPFPDKYWTFTPGKDIFVTLDSSANIRPQTGTYAGWSGQSASGHSLKNNISANDIKPIHD